MRQDARKSAWAGSCNAPGYLVRGRRARQGARASHAGFNRMLCAPAPAPIVNIANAGWDRFTKARGNGTFLGFNFASDESPPSERRFCGLRFQVTHVYIVYTKPKTDWDNEEFLRKCPIVVDRFLCDLMHCPGKTGADVFTIVQKQFNAKGLYAHECCSGVGDGGGENEGSSGVHSVMETANPSYVRRRCFGHFPWRVADQGITAMGETMAATQSLCVYLRDGITWSRLKGIATQTPEMGGLALMQEGTPEYNRFFTKAPPNIMEDRPETASEFLKWLVPREKILARLVTHDVDQRSLRLQQARTAVETLNNRDHMLKRMVCQVLVAKGLFMYFYCKKNPHIAFKTTFSDLLSKASTVVTNLTVDEDFFHSAPFTREDVLAKGITANDLLSMTWVELLLRMRDDIDEGERQANMEELLKFHSAVSLRMASHMKLTASNMERTPWLMARILCPDPIRAVEGANEFFEHLIRRTEEQLTAFERAIMHDDELRIQLEQFKDQPGEPHTWVCVWQRNGQYAKLFTFLAVRFGGAPDSVLQCEGPTFPSHSRDKLVSNPNSSKLIKCSQSSSSYVCSCLKFR